MVSPEPKLSGHLEGGLKTVGAAQWGCVHGRKVCSWGFKVQREFTQLQAERLRA